MNKYNKEEVAAEPVESSPASSSGGVLKPILGVTLETLGRDSNDPFAKRVVISSDPGSHDDLTSSVASDSGILATKPLNIIDRDAAYDANDATAARAVTRPSADFDGAAFNSYFSTSNVKLNWLGFNIQNPMLGVTSAFVDGTDYATKTAALAGSGVRKLAVAKQFIDLVPIRAGQVADLSGSEPAHNKLTNLEQHTNELSYHTDMNALAMTLRRYNELVYVTEKLSHARKVGFGVTKALRDPKVRVLMDSISDIIAQYGTYYGDTIIPHLKWTSIAPARSKSNLGSMNLIVPMPEIDVYNWTVGTYTNTNYIKPLSADTTTLTFGELIAFGSYFMQALADINDSADYTRFNKFATWTNFIIDNFAQTHTNVIRFYTHLYNKSEALRSKHMSFGQLYSNHLNKEVAVIPLLSRFIEYLPGIVTGDDGADTDVISLIRHDLDKIVVIDSPVMPEMDFGDYLETFDFQFIEITTSSFRAIGLIHVFSGIQISRSSVAHVPVTSFYYADSNVSSVTWWAPAQSAAFPVFEVGGTQDPVNLLTLLTLRDSYRMKFLTATTLLGSIGDDSNFVLLNFDNTTQYQTFPISNYAPIYTELANNILPKDIYAQLGARGFTKR